MEIIEDFKPGQTFEIDFPFVSYAGIGEGVFWQPGCRFSGEYGEPAEADAYGKKIIKVVDTFTPSGRKKIVLYTQNWLDPEGRTTKNYKMYMKGVVAFNTLLKGFRYELEIKTEDD